MNSSASTRHQEIERKYIVARAESVQRFLQAIEKLSKAAQVQAYQRESCDLYLVIPARLPYIFRYRYDHELQQLTAKSLQDRFPIRQEITLAFDNTALQKDSVLALAHALGVEWQGELRKQLTIYRFADCEVVLYRASFGSETVTCIEVEALAAASIDQGLAVVDRYCSALALADYGRESSKSLFELLVIPRLPTAIREQIARYLPT